MASNSSMRGFMPQGSSKVGQFTFVAPTYSQPRDMQKNYVFVDEHNRHKRLKVMRACEGCRRRKIKCDAATTNTWPCSACMRLKLHCVKPNGQSDDPTYDSSDSYHDSGSMRSGSTHAEKFSQISTQQDALTVNQPKPGEHLPRGSYPEGQDLFETVSYSQTHSQHNIHYTTIPPSTCSMEQPYRPVNAYPPGSATQPTPHSTSSPESYTSDFYGHQNLTQLLGNLQVDETGTAPYLSKKGFRNLEEEPALEDGDDIKASVALAPAPPGSRIRIPPELMPDESTALHYFDLYFANVHPYVPVLEKTHFYQQWHNDRKSISPLILEAIFAVSGRLADEPSLGQQWIALASKHLTSFADMPRLSTLQGLLILLKAREAQPKKGYYYRSWMTIVQGVAMAKDLGLDEHFEDHKAGKACDSNPTDCLIKRRVWQTLFICEVMTGAAQGRTDLSIDLDSVDFSLPVPIPGSDDAEAEATRNFTYLSRVVQNISRMNTVYAKIKKKKDWGIDPDFMQLNPTLKAWLDDLPADMAITFPSDGSPPWLSSHIIGNTHSYYYLSLILLHRPQLTFLDPSSLDGQWKFHMTMCYSSAKLLCRIQESMLQSYGLAGLQCMQRGISFTIYAILSCIVIHLVAITSPDPELNLDAKEYFTRHMRILEKTMGSWPIPEMIRQIDAVREAFSADTRKPFVLRSNFPHGSPALGRASPPQGDPPVNHTLCEDIMGQNMYNHPITPPVSTGPIDMKDDSPTAQSIALMSTGQTSQATPVSHVTPMQDPSAWNPSRIFDQWNTSFGTQQSEYKSTPDASQSLNVSSSIPGAPEASQSMPPSLSPVNGSAPVQYSGPPMQDFITPAMWQESVASVYAAGFKRQWEFDGEAQLVDQPVKRR